MEKLKVVFMGNTNLSKYILENLVKDSNIEVVKLVVSDQNVKKIPTLEVAFKENIDVLRTKKLKDHISIFQSLNHDLIITCAFGKILPKSILQTSKIGNLNVHTSILPKYRGASPIQHALFNLDKQTGVSIIEMVEKMDAGDVYALETIKIEKKDNYESIEEKMKKPAFIALKKAIKTYISGEDPLFVQFESEVSFAPILKREDEKINLSLKGLEIEGKIKGLSETPGAYLFIENKTIKILEGYFENKKAPGEIGEIVFKDKKSFDFKVKDGIIKVFKVQLEGKKKMDCTSFLNGYSNIIGKILK